MTQGNRVNEIRKSLALTLEKFGSKLGVGKTAISKLEKGENNLTDQMAKSICREFNVNPQWLATGEGEMFQSLDTFSLDEFAKQHNATELELNILRAYFELDADLRGKLLKHFKERLYRSCGTENNGNIQTKQSVQQRPF